ncbi:MAG TPA: site-2 protease family protein [Gemmatimonadaceae bacterium]
MDTLQTILFVAPVLLFSVIAHEIAHGYAALKQGDHTAQSLGRLSWNPLRHIDPFMTVLPLMTGIGSLGKVVLGGAKPVPVNPANYRHRRRGDIIVSLAGVTANGLIALGCTVLIALLGAVSSVAPGTSGIVGMLQAMAYYGVGLNLILIAFNLIPIPPLDGSHVMKYLLPPALSLKYQQMTRYGILVLVVLLYFGRGAIGVWMQPALYVGNALIGSVDRFIEPSAERWIR